MDTSEKFRTLLKEAKLFDGRYESLEGTSCVGKRVIFSGETTDGVAVLFIGVIGSVGLTSAPDHGDFLMVNMSAPFFGWLNGPAMSLLFIATDPGDGRQWKIADASLSNSRMGTLRGRLKFPR